MSAGLVVGGCRDARVLAPIMVPRVSVERTRFEVARPIRVGEFSW